MLLLGFPLLLIPFAIYLIIALLMPGLSFTDTLFTLTLLSGARLAISISDILVVFAILLLFVELLKATRVGSRSVVDHMLSLVLFVAAVIVFLVVARAASSTFLLLLTLSFVDVIGGFAVTLRSSQRDIALEGIERV